MTEPKMTPMMKQYLRIKQDYQDCLLFYRLGDFYELFFEDAQIASQILGLVLTSRGKTESTNIPMCGIPFHAYHNYLTRLIKAGFKVAICEQTEDPTEAKKRGASAIVERDVIRIVTAGTLLEDDLLDAKKNNFLTTIVSGIDDFALAWVDLSTGSFFTQTASKDEISSVILRLDPAEILLPDNFMESHPNVLKEKDERYSFWGSEHFSFIKGKEKLCSFFKNQTFDSFERHEIMACGALLDYLLHTQKGAHPTLRVPQKNHTNKFMEIDASTRLSLELTTSLSNTKNDSSVLKTIDQTKTAMGARLLCTHLSNPLMDLTDINNRLDKIDFFIQNPIKRDKIRDILKLIPDIERGLSRILLGNSGPKEILSIAYGLEKIPAIRELISTEMTPASLQQDVNLLGEYTGLIREIISAIKPDDTPHLTRTGGFINKGYSAPLDELLTIQLNAKNTIATMQQHYAEKTGISNLKISFNNLVGYYVEVPTRSADPLLNDKSLGFIHRQTMLNVMRFTTDELMEFETKITHAKDLSLEMEIEIFNHLVSLIRVQSEELATTCIALAQIDIASSLAYYAEIHNWTRPILTDDNSFEIRAGRHPVVEKFLEK